MMTVEHVSAFRAAFPHSIEYEPMSQHTNMRMGGPARLFIAATSVDEAIAMIQEAVRLQMPFAFIGGGSNMIVSDLGFDGLVIQPAFRAFEITHTVIRADTGSILSQVARAGAEAGLEGFEWAATVPGTVGGALFGNAGCFGGDMGQVVVSVDTFRLSDRVRVTLDRAACQFAYRESLFKHASYLLLGCTIQLAHAVDPLAPKKRMEALMRTRQEKQPFGASSAGCIFKNALFTSEADIEILRRRISTIPETMLANKSLGAGWLIDQVGMTGQRIGDAEISTKHGNFFLNTGHARAQDMIALISFAKMKVRDELGIELHEEVQLLGF